MRYRLRAATVLGTVGVVALMAAGCGSRDADPAADGSGASGSVGAPSAAGSPAPEPASGGSDGAAGQQCAAGDFQLGNWEQSGARDPGPVSGIAATGDASCARLRISFDGPAPGVRMWRPSEGNHTYVSLAADFLDVDPVGPVESDLVWPELALLSTAIITADQGGITVVAIHDDHTDVAARASVAEHHVDVYFRTAQPDDPRVDDSWPGGPHQLRVAGETGQGLLVTHTGAADGRWVLIQGYAKAPESNVVVRVQVAGSGVVCDRPQIAAGPPYLYSWFQDACQVPIPNDYEIQVGWPGLAGPTHDVWQWYDVPVG